MNKIAKAIGEIKFLSTVTTVCIASSLVFGFPAAPACASSLFKADVKRVPPPAFPTHDGRWFFDVQVIPGAMPSVKLTVVGTPGIVNTVDNDQFLNAMYVYEATESNGKYTFMGDTGGLGIMMGMFTPGERELMISSPVTSGPFPYEITNVMPVPESDFTLSLLAFGTVGAACFFKSKLKSALLND